MILKMVKRCRKKLNSKALWVSINDYPEKNLFHVYPRLLADLLLQEESARIEGDISEAEKLVLPSDREWRLEKYFYLIELQNNREIECGDVQSRSRDTIEEWAPWKHVVHTKNPNAPPPVVVRTTPGPAWDIKQVLKAGRLLSKPPMKVDFIDEQDMRRVYSVIYDVFRYKSVLEQAIDDVDFFGECPQLGQYHQTVWLFIMELARRRWAARPRGELETVNQLLEEAGSPFKEVETAVWQQRVHFAAAIARIRIKNKAFALADLLPPHLRDERMQSCINKETVTGWVNTFKAKKVASLVQSLHELGYSYSNSRQLCAGEYRFDRVCPRFITFRPPADVSIGSMHLVRDGVIVLQEREFCEGASTLCRALRANSLCGVVAQTHASSPRSSAYLAAQLRELAAVLKSKTPSAPATPELGKLVVFGAGDKVESYVCALRELGIEASEMPASGAPVCVISDPVHWDTPAVVNALEGVVAALATPPNSYSSVGDPIDLVCGRGGDLAMLEALTDTEIHFEGRERAKSILDEQKKTLKSLLSKPQIQLILYETHSALEAENQAQVTRAVAEANRLARERHTFVKKSPKGRTTLERRADSSHSIDNTISCSDLDKDYMDDDAAIDDDDRTTTSVTTARSRPESGNETARTVASSVLKKKSEVNLETRTRSVKARPIPGIPIPDFPVPQDPDKDSPDVYVPDCDLFEIRKLPILANGLDINYILDRDGCYLGLIQRKEITHMDARFMIKVAEERGLFAQAAQPTNRRKKEAPATAPRRRRRKAAGFEVERVAAPTYASMMRMSTHRRGSAPANLITSTDCVCERHLRRQAAASSYTAAACTCDAHHRTCVRQRRPPSESTRPPVPPPSPPCRRPFPVAVKDVHLYAYNLGPHNKIISYDFH